MEVVDWIEQLQDQDKGIRDNVSDALIPTCTSKA